MPSTPILILTQGHAGDRLGSRLVSALRERFPDCELIGVGGGAMDAAGVPLIARADTISAMGWTGLPPVVPALYRVLRRTQSAARRRPPAVVVAVDVWQPLQFLHRYSPELRAAPHVCYMPPGPNLIAPARVHSRAAAAFKGIVTPFRYQAPLFEQAGARVRLAAHAGMKAMLAEVTPLPASDREPILALLPGSRAAEIRYGLGVQWEAAQQIIRQRPELRPIVCCSDEAVEREVRARFPGAVTHRNAQEVMGRARFGLICSGTASLEAALLGCPGLVTYNVSPLQRWEYYTFHKEKLGRLRGAGIASPYIGMPNILAGRELYPELLDSNAADISTAALKALESDPQASAAALADVKDALAWDDPGAVVAEEVARALETPAGVSR
jgi:lipid-A-disaccharide synthase